jgi:hypothetical protein
MDPPLMVKESLVRHLLGNALPFEFGGQCPEVFLLRAHLAHRASGGVIEEAIDIRGGRGPLVAALRRSPRGKGGRPLLDPVLICGRLPLARAELGDSIRSLASICPACGCVRI